MEFHDRWIELSCWRRDEWKTHAARSIRRRSAPAACPCCVRFLVRRKIEILGFKSEFIDCSEASDRMTATEIYCWMASIVGLLFVSCRADEASKRWLWWTKTKSSCNREVVTFFKNVGPEENGHGSRLKKSLIENCDRLELDSRRCDRLIWLRPEVRSAFEEMEIFVYWFDWWIVTSRFGDVWIVLSSVSTWILREFLRHETLGNGISAALC